jgi:hypothetical protein
MESDSLQTISHLSGQTGDIFAAEATVKGRQLALGRAKKTVELRTTVLADTRNRLAMAKQTLGEVIDDDGLDSSVANKAMVETANQVIQMESALAVARQRAGQAEMDLRTAESLLVVETQRQAIVALKLQIAPKAEQLLRELEQFVEEELVPALNSARVAYGQGTQSSFVTDLSLTWEHYVLKACRTLVKRGFVSMRLLGGQTFTSRIPDSEMAVRKEGSAATMDGRQYV